MISSFPNSGTSSVSTKSVLNIKSTTSKSNNRKSKNEDDAASINSTQHSQSNGGVVGPLKNTLSIHLPESVIMLRTSDTTGRNRHNEGDSSPSYLRGILVLELVKPTRISKIVVELGAKVVTVWPSPSADMAIGGGYGGRDVTESHKVFSSSDVLFSASQGPPSNLTAFTFFEDETPPTSPTPTIDADIADVRSISTGSGTITPGRAMSVDSTRTRRSFTAEPPPYTPPQSSPSSPLASPVSGNYTESRISFLPDVHASREHAPNTSQSKSKSRSRQTHPYAAPSIPEDVPTPPTSNELVDSSERSADQTEADMNPYEYAQAHACAHLRSQRSLTQLNQQPPHTHPNAEGEAEVKQDQDDPPRGRSQKKRFSLGRFFTKAFSRSRSKSKPPLDRDTNKDHSPSRMSARSGITTVSADSDAKKSKRSISRPWRRNRGSIVTVSTTSTAGTMSTMGTMASHTTNTTDTEDRGLGVDEMGVVDISPSPASIITNDTSHDLSYDDGSSILPPSPVPPFPSPLPSIMSSMSSRSRSADAQSSSHVSFAPPSPRPPSLLSSMSGKSRQSKEHGRSSSPQADGPGWKEFPRGTYTYPILFTVPGHAPPSFDTSLSQTGQYKYRSNAGKDSDLRTGDIELEDGFSNGRPNLHVVANLPHCALKWQLKANVHRPGAFASKMQTTRPVHIVSAPCEDDGTGGGSGTGGAAMNGGGGGWGGESVIVERTWDGGPATGGHGTSPPMPSSTSRSILRPPLPLPPASRPPLPPPSTPATLISRSSLSASSTSNNVRPLPPPPPTSSASISSTPSRRGHSVPPNPYDSINLSTSNSPAGTLHYLLTISGRSFPIGGFIPIELTLMPLEKVRIHRLSVLVEQKIEYHTHFKRVARTDPVLSIPLVLLKDDSGSGKEHRHILPLESDDPDALRKSPLYSTMRAEVRRQMRAVRKESGSDYLDDSHSDSDGSDSDNSDLDSESDSESSSPIDPEATRSRRRRQHRHQTRTALSELASSLMGPGPWTVPFGLPLPLAHASNFTKPQVRSRAREDLSTQDVESPGTNGSSGRWSMDMWGDKSKKDEKVTSKEKEKEMVDVGRGLLPSNKNRRSNVTISHLLKCIIRVERVDSEEEGEGEGDSVEDVEGGRKSFGDTLNDVERSGWDDEFIDWERARRNKETNATESKPKPKPKKKKKLFDIVVQTPIQILSCRCNPEFSTLPGYAPPGSDSIESDSLGLASGLLPSSIPISPLSHDTFATPCSSWSSSPTGSGAMPDQIAGGLTTSVCCPCVLKARQIRARSEQAASLKQQRIQQKMEQMHESKRMERKASDRPQRYEENQDPEYNHDKRDKEFEMEKKRRSKARRRPITPLPPPPPTSPPLLPLPPPPPITIDPAHLTTQDHKQRSQKRMSSSSMSSTGLESSTSSSHPPSILRNSMSTKRTSLTSSFSGLSGLSFGGAVKPNGPIERRLTVGSQMSQSSHLTESSNFTQSTSSTSAFAASSMYTTSRSSSMMHSMSSRQFEDLVAGHLNEAGQAPPSYEHVASILQTRVVMADRV